MFLHPKTKLDSFVTSMKDYFVCLCYITTPSLDWIFFLNLHKLIEVTWCLLADVSFVQFHFR